MFELASPLRAQQFSVLLDLESRRYSDLAGVYRNGLMAVFSSKEALYLSNQQESGPFTVYVPGLQSHLMSCHTGQEIYIDNKTIAVIDAGLTIDLKCARPWPRNRTPKLAAWPKIETGIRSSLEMVLAMTGQQSLALIAASKLLLGQRSGPSPTALLWMQFRYALTQLSTTTLIADLDGIGTAASLLLGLGQGTTPAGDDVLAGYLTALWHVGNASHLSVDESNEIRAGILQLRHGRTNLLSSALLWAAAYGETGGTLNSALRLLIGGDPLPKELIRNLSNVGHSSGLDGLAGVMIFLHCCIRALATDPG